VEEYGKEWLLTDRVVQVVEYLPGKHEVLTSKSSTIPLPQEKERMIPQLSLPSLKSVSQSKKCTISKNKLNKNAKYNCYHLRKYKGTRVSPFINMVN
jgi:hypothetical protein